MNIYDFLLSFIQFTIAPITTLLAGVYGVKYGIKQFKEQKKIDIVENQLNKFYSPLLALHKEIKSKGEVRFKLKKAGDIVWEKMSAEISIYDEKTTADAIKYVDKEIDYNNKQFEDELLPLYSKMIEIFRDNFWLAEPETRKYYYNLIEFVEIWKRWLLKTIIPDVIKEIDQGEANLHPFYEELENRTNILKDKITK